MSRLPSLNLLRKEVFRPVLQLGNSTLLHRPITPATASASATNAVTVLTSIRNATKKAAGSKTSNKDSRGRRLGSKKSDGQEVKVGEIIYRQRGTKIYPGENTGLGKDHTIFALEPGHVRFYYDPFHPNRKFAGVVLNKDHRLPSPHFAPTARRFGRVEIVDAELAEKEKSNMSRKEFLANPKIEEVKNARRTKREEARTKFSTELTGLISGLSEEETSSAVSRLMAIKVYLSGGRSVVESRKFADRDFKIDTQVAERAQKLTSEEAVAQLANYSALAQKLDAAVSFDPKFELIKAYSVEELEASKKEKLDAIIALYTQASSVVTKETQQQIISLIDSPCFPLSYRVDLRRKYVKAHKPEFFAKTEQSESLTKKEIQQLVDKKKGSLIKRWNYLTSKVDLVYVPRA